MTTRSIPLLLALIAALNATGTAQPKGRRGREDDKKKLEQVPEKERHVFRFNLGRAHERAGNRAKALAAYRRVIQDQPSFDPAVNGLFRTLRASDDPERIRTAADDAGTLLDRGASRLARAYASRPDS